MAVGEETLLNLYLSASY